MLGIKKWIEIFDYFNATYKPNKDVRFKTSQLRNDLCDFNDSYIVVTGKITATDPDPDPDDDYDDDIVYDRTLALKNSPAPFFNCILKINGQLIEDAQVFDIVMLMYNVLYYSKIFRKTTGSFWKYYLDMPSSEYVSNNERTIVFYPINNSKHFDYKTKLVGKLRDNEDELEDVKIVVPLKNLSRFMFSLDFLMINPEIKLVLKWTQDCVLTEEAEREHKEAKVGPLALNEVDAVNRPYDLKFNVTDCKLYVPVLTLENEYQNQLYRQLKTGISIDFT